jgi:ABC-2 type transport system permease protein
VIGMVMAGARLELRLVRANPNALIPLLTAPLFSTIFLMIVRHAGEVGLTANAFVAPVIMTFWWFALFQGGFVITRDRWEGVLEWVVATPIDIAAVVVGRVASVMAIAPIGLLEVWAVANLGFHAPFRFYHPVVFAAGLLLAMFAMLGTAVAFAALFVLARNAFTFANSASFPFYVLGGVFIPVSILPAWIRPLSSAIFMSWAADLLRATMRPGPIDDSYGRLGAIAALGLVNLLVGQGLLRAVVRRMRDTGELAVA